MSFKDEIKGHYSSQELSLEELSELQGVLANKEKKSLFFRFCIGSLPLAVACSVVFFIFLLRPIDHQIISEVVRNHIKNEKLMVINDDMGEIQKGLTHLGFTLIRSKKLSFLKLVGARYCSINGKLAAQLSYVDKEGRRSTVYQVPWDKGLSRELKNSRGKSLAYNGLKVSMYEEKGILVVAASSHGLDIDEH